MKGYHYTSLSNWNIIQKEGLIPYSINKPEVIKYYPNGLKAIWTWRKELKGDSEIGSILFQVSTKQSKEIVKLEYDYTEEDIVTYGKRKCKLYHDGILGNWSYHDKESAYLLRNKIQN